MHHNNLPIGLDLEYKLDSERLQQKIAVVRQQNTQAMEQLGAERLKVEREKARLNTLNEQRLSRDVEFKQAIAERNASVETITQSDFQKGRIVIEQHEIINKIERVRAEIKTTFNESQVDSRLEAIIKEKNEIHNKLVVLQKKVTTNEEALYKMQREIGAFVFPLSNKAKEQINILRNEYNKLNKETKKLDSVLKQENVITQQKLLPLIHEEINLFNEKERLIELDALREKKEQTEQVLTHLNSKISLSQSKLEEANRVITAITELNVEIERVKSFLIQAPTSLQSIEFIIARTGRECSECVTELNELDRLERLRQFEQEVLAKASQVDPVLYQPKIEIKKVLPVLDQEGKDLLAKIQRHLTSLSRETRCVTVNHKILVLEKCQEYLEGKCEQKDVDSLQTGCPNWAKRRGIIGYLGIFGDRNTTKDLYTAIVSYKSGKRHAKQGRISL